MVLENKDVVRALASVSHPPIIVPTAEKNMDPDWSMMVRVVLLRTVATTDPRYEFATTSKY